MGDSITLEKIMNITFNKENKFLSILYNDLNLQVVNLTKIKKKDVCICRPIQKEKSSFDNLVDCLKVSLLIYTEKLIFEDKNNFASFKCYCDLPREEYLERTRSINSENEIVVFFERVNEIV